MFETDLASLPTRDLLEQAAGCRAVANRSDAQLLECAQIYADRHHPSSCEPRVGRSGGRGAGSGDGRERGVVLGGDGCPEVAEFCVAEFAVVIGVSPGVGRAVLADALALRHRFPRTWLRILEGEATPWKARQIVQACTRLHRAAAEYVDHRVADVVDSISPYRLTKLIQAAKRVADPALAAAEAAEAADRRGVFVTRGNRGDEHGTKTMCIIAPAAGIHRLDARIAQLAQALNVLGDQRPVQHRRADAATFLADPAFALELLTQTHHTSQSAQSNQSNQSTRTPTQSAQTPTDPTATTPAPATGTETQPSTGTQAQSSTEAEPSTGTKPTVETGSITGHEPITGHETSIGREPSAGHEPRTGPHLSTDSRLGTDPEASVGVEPIAGHGACSGREPYAAPRPSAGPCLSVDLLESIDLMEPWGPPDDPWLEAAGPCDPDPPTDPFWLRSVTAATDPVEGSDSDSEPGEGSAMDAAALRALDARLAQIRQDAYANPSYSTHPAHCTHCSHCTRCGHSSVAGNGQACPDGPGWVRGRVVRVRPGQTEVIVHLTDRTLASGTGVVRVEGIGPLLVSQLGELIGHGPYTVKPVIDLNEAVSVNAYEIPPRIRERVRLMHPVELFPYGTRETGDGIDLDHIQPYDPYGPAGQTSTGNLAPLGRFGHRVKTHARGWSVRRIDDHILEWTTPHGFTFHVDHNGTQRVDRGSTRLPYDGQPDREDPCRDS